MRHTWVLQVFTGRPSLGPHAIAKYERELSVIDGIGLTDIEMDAVITLVHTHVEGVARRRIEADRAVRRRIEADRAVRRTGISDEQSWQKVQPLVAEVFDPAAMPCHDTNIHRHSVPAHSTDIGIHRHSTSGITDEATGWGGSGQPVGAAAEPGLLDVWEASAVGQPVHQGA